MKYLIDQPHEHNYIYLKKETVPIPEPLLKLIEKTVFACIDCGSGLDVYDFDNVQILPERKD